MDELFDDKNKVKVKYNNIKFGKVGDWFKGTLTDNTRQVENTLSPKREMQTVFEMMAHGGSLHLINDRVVDENPTEVKKGDFWSFLTGKAALLSQLKGARLGQVIGLRFAETKKSKTKGFTDSKIIEVYLGDMDPEYQGQTAND